MRLFEGVIESPTAAVAATATERGVHGPGRDRARPEHEQRVLVSLSRSVPMRVLQAIDPEGGEYEQDRARSAVRIATVTGHQSQAASECKMQREKREVGERT